jgi:hypothetical protein
LGQAAEHAAEEAHLKIMESGCIKFVDIVQQLEEEMKDMIEERLNNIIEQVQFNKNQRTRGWPRSELKDSWDFFQNVGHTKLNDA